MDTMTNPTEKKKSCHLQKLLTAVIGGLVVIIGIIAIPYPGPGWLIVFAGLGILAREFPWAARLLKVVKGRYDEWYEWVKHQGIIVKALLFLFTSIIVVVTIWLINGYGLLNDWLHLGQDWLVSPFV